MNAERRRQPRIQWSGQAAAALGRQRVSCDGANLSKTGACLAAGWRAYEGQRVQLSFELQGRPVHVQGVVTWACPSDARHHWGVRFTVVHPSHQRRIDAFIDQSLRRQQSRGRPPLERRRPPVPAGQGRFDLPEEAELRGEADLELPRAMPTISDSPFETMPQGRAPHLKPPRPPGPEDLFDDRPTGVFEPDW